MRALAYRDRGDPVLPGTLGSEAGRLQPGELTEAEAAVQMDSGAVVPNRGDDGLGGDVAGGEPGGIHRQQMRAV